MDFSIGNLLADFNPPQDRQFGQALKTMREHRLKTAVPEVAAAVSKFKDEAFKNTFEYSVLKKTFFSGYYSVKEAVHAINANLLVSQVSRSYIDDALEDIRHALKSMKTAIMIAEQNSAAKPDEVVFWRLAANRLDALNLHLQNFQELRNRGDWEQRSRPSPIRQPNPSL